MNSDSHAGCCPALWFTLLCGGPAESFSCCCSIPMLHAPALSVPCWCVLPHAQNNNAVSLISNFVEDIKSCWTCCVNVTHLSVLPKESNCTNNQIYCRHMHALCDGLHINSVCIKASKQWRLRRSYLFEDYRGREWAIDFRAARIFVKQCLDFL